MKSVKKLFLQKIQEETEKIRDTNPTIAPMEERSRLIIDEQLSLFLGGISKDKETEDETSKESSKHPNDEKEEINKEQ